MISRRDLALVGAGLAFAGWAGEAEACSIRPLDLNEGLPAAFLQALVSGRRAVAEAMLADNATGLKTSSWRASEAAEGKAAVATLFHDQIRGILTAEYDADQRARFQFGATITAGQWRVVPAAIVSRGELGLSLGTCPAGRNDEYWFALGNDMGQDSAATRIARVMLIEGAQRA